MKLIITRHGESEENSSGTLQGLLPGKLSDSGKIQADKLGKRLTQEKIDIIYSSPVNRCQETLSFIQKYIGISIPVVTSDLIQERDFGTLSGKSWNEIDYNKLDLDTPENRAMGVESLGQVRNRMSQFLEEIKSKYSKKTVLVISHSNPIRMLFAELLNMTFAEVLEKIKIRNASISILELSDNGINPIVINETEFLS